MTTIILAATDGSDLLTKATKVRAACVAALEVCAKRTPGEWEASENIDTRLHSDVTARGGEDWIADCDRLNGLIAAECNANAAFIALASCMTEPALRSTVLMLDMIDGLSQWDNAIVRKEAGLWLTALLDCWPEETAK